METLVLSFFYLFFFFTHTASKDICNLSYCLPTEPPIRFPFQLTGHQPDECGYSGFSLSCNNNNQTILNLPSGDVIVKSISYSDQTAMVDPQFCSPNRINSFTLTGTPFAPKYQKFYRFFNCSKSLDIRTFLSVVPFDCLNGPNSTVFALPIAYAGQVPINGSCQIISDIAIPTQNSYEDSKQEIQLEWSYPRCYYCEQFNHGTCQAKPKHPDETVCRSSSSISLSASAKFGLIIGLGLSFLLCSIGLV